MRPPPTLAVNAGALRPPASPPRPTFANLLIYGASACFLCFSLKPFPIFLGFICILRGFLVPSGPADKGFCCASYAHIGHGLGRLQGCLGRPRRNARRKEIIFLSGPWMLGAGIPFEQQETASSAATATPQRSVPPPPDPEPANRRPPAPLQHLSICLVRNEAA